MPGISLDLVEIPGGPFLLGADYDALPADLRAADQAKALGMGAVLASTPPRWVDLPAFSIMPRMVTNQLYQKFWEFPHPEQNDLLLVDEIQIWEYVWQLYPLQSIRIPASEAGSQLAEDYTHCTTAIDALVRSHAYECQRLLLGHHVPPTEPGFDELSRAVVGVFAALRRGLATLIWNGAPALSRGEERSIAEGEDTPARWVNEVDRLLKALEVRNTRAMPLAVILRRVRQSLVDPSREGLGFKVSTIFRPITWPDEGVPRRAGGLFANRVPWEELPVRGVSLYEAAAFAAWLRLATGQPMSLPSEAEYEKAFGWDTAVSTLEHCGKHVYPWQDHNQQDFNYWFSRDGSSLQSLEARPAAYRELLEASARISNGKRLYQGLGFGWQWTRERFNELERKYNRFDHAGVNRHKQNDVVIYEYKDVNDLNCRYFAVRGAPDQLGGPGTVTRRFALNPLRGYAECGFRCVAGKAGEL